MVWCFNDQHGCACASWPSAFVLGGGYGDGEKGSDLEFIWKVEIINKLADELVNRDLCLIKVSIIRLDA